MPSLNVPAALTASLIAICPAPSLAHPHVFIDTGLKLIMSEGRVTHVEVTWLYDELYTLWLLDDYQLDLDLDMELTEEEISETLGFDLNWNSGFDGGLVLWRDGVELELGDPEPVSMDMVQPGQIVTTHRRRVEDPGTGRLVASAFDEAFYIAMEMIGPMEVSGAECTSELLRADLDEAYSVLEDAIEAIGGAVSAEDNFPPVGAHFADKVEFTCVG